MVSLKVNDKIEAYVKLDGRVFSFESQVVHIHDDQVVVLWDKGSEVTPQMVHNGFPAYLEGLRVFHLQSDPEYHATGYGWGRVIRKIEPPKKTKQIHRTEPGGMVCMNCTNMVQYASANMSDGSFCCRNCRLYKGYMLPIGVTYIGYVGERDK
jgi:hypothetical protein